MIHRQILWDAGKPTPLLRSAWVRAGGAQPLLPTTYLEQDLSAKPILRALWQQAFPDRDPLPYGPLSTKEGRGTDAFLDVLA